MVTLFSYPDSRALLSVTIVARDIGVETMKLSNIVTKADSAFGCGEYDKAARLYRDVAESMEYEAWVKVGDSSHCNSHIFWGLHYRAQKALPY